MIEMPNLPHDNLYKFLCFGGLALVISSVYFWLEFETRLKEAYVQNAKAKAVTAAEREKIRLQVRPILVRLVEEEISPEERSELSKQLPWVNEKLSESEVLSIHQKLNEFQRDALELDRVIAAPFLILGFVGGLFMTCVGIYFWWTKIQIPSDQLLEASLRPKRLRRRLKA